MWVEGSFTELGATILDRIKNTNYPTPLQKKSNEEGSKKQKRAILASLKCREGRSRCSIHFIQDCRFDIL